MTNDPRILPGSYGDIVFADGDLHAVTTGPGFVRCVDLDTGLERWHRNEPTGWLMFLSAIYDPVTGQVLATGKAHDGNAAVVVGATVRTVIPCGPGNYPSAFGVRDGRPVVYVMRGEGVGNAVGIYDPLTGTLLERVPLPAEVQDSSQGIRFIADDGAIMYGDRTLGITLHGQLIREYVQRSGWTAGQAQEGGGVLVADAQRIFRLLPLMAYFPRLAVDGDRVAVLKVDSPQRVVVQDVTPPYPTLDTPVPPTPTPPVDDTPPEPRSEPIRSGKVIEDTLEYVLGAPGLFPRDGTHALDQVLYPAEQAIRFVKFAKGNAHETWRWDDRYIYHWEDASHRAYYFSDGRWLKRRATVGERMTVEGNRIVQFTDDCQLAGSAAFPYSTWIEAYYPRYWCGRDLGEREVIVLVYHTGTGPGRHYEKFYFARGAGWIRWEYLDSVTDAREADADFYKVGGTSVASRGSCRGLPPRVSNPDPIPEPEPEPMPDVPSLLESVKAVWDRGVRGAAFVNEVAWRGNGNSASGHWGVSYLKDGVAQPRTGKRISPVILHYAPDPAAAREDGTLGTLFLVAEGPAVREVASHGDPDRNWLPPVEPESGTPAPNPGTLEARVAALEARVTALEQEQPPIEPPTDPIEQQPIEPVDDAEMPTPEAGRETVERIFTSLGEPRTVEGAFAVALGVARTYRAAGCGFVRGPAGGENVVEYRGGFVRAARVSFRGQTVKLLTDVPTTNGPTWSVDDFEPELYVPFEG